MEKYFAKFGIPISVVVVVVIIVVVIVLTIITVKSTKENNNSLSYMVDNTTNEDAYKYILTMDISRNYKKINISDVYAYADNLIKDMVTKIVADISDVDILKHFYNVLRENDTVVEATFTNLYNKKKSLILEKLRDITGATFKSSGTKSSTEQMILDRANSMTNNTSLSTNKSIRVTSPSEGEASLANKYNMYNSENGRAEGFLYHQHGYVFGNYLKLGRPENQRPHPPIEWEVSIRPNF